MDPLRRAIMASVQAASIQPAPPDLPPNELTPEVYARWLPLPVAVKRLEPILSGLEAKAEIHTRLCGGEIIAAARTANCGRTMPSPFATTT